MAFHLTETGGLHVQFHKGDVKD